MIKTATKAVALTLLKEVPTLAGEAQKLSIQDAKQMGYAAEVLSRLNKKADALKKEKEVLTKPLNDTLKEIRSRYKPAEDQLGDAIDIVRGKMSDYQTAETKRAEIEAHKIAGRVGDGKGKLKAETAMRQIAEIDAPAQSVEAESGAVQFRTQKNIIIDNHVDVVDWLVANKMYEAIEIDERHVKAILESGIAVAGARIEERQVPVNFR